MKRIAIVSTELGFGGPSAVAVWMMEALNRDYRVISISPRFPDFYNLNKFFNTSLNNNLEVIKIDTPFLFKYISRLSLLKQHLLMRFCKKNVNNFTEIVDFMVRLCIIDLPS